MKQKLAVLFLLLAFLVPGITGAVEKDDFKVDNTQDFVDLCIVPADHPYYIAAVHFVHGYLVGAYGYYEAQAAGPKGDKFICLPENMPSRNEVVNMFLKWAKGHPEYMEKRAVNTIFRFLAETWPCK